MANELRKRVVMTTIGAVDASAGAPVNVFVAPCRCVIVGVDLVNGSAIALGSTGGDYNIQNKGLTGSGTTEVASLSTITAAADANAIAADMAEAWTLSTTLASLEIAEGESLQFTPSETASTGGDLTEASIAVHYVPGTGLGN